MTPILVGFATKTKEEQTDCPRKFEQHMHWIDRLLRPLRGRLLTALLAALPAFAAYGQSGSTPLIWEVRSTTNTSYLFGTIHVGARKLYPLSRAVEDAFASAQVLALEADPTDALAVGTAAAGAAYTPPDTLANHISPALMEDLTRSLPALGLPIEYARVMRPSLLAMTIEMMEVSRHGYDPALGLDTYLARRAKQTGKRIVELESIREQLALLNSFSDELQEGMLRSALDSVADGTLGNQLRDLVAAWRAGDSQKLLAQVDQDTDQLPPALAQEYEHALYVTRNYAMVDKLVPMLEAGTPVFVAVGTGHLLGPQGLVELLKAKGYRIRQL